MRTGTILYRPSRGSTQQRPSLRRWHACVLPWPPPPPRVLTPTGLPRIVRQGGDAVRPLLESAPRPVGASGARGRACSHRSALTFAAAQYWRLFTNFFFFGTLGIDFLFHLFFLCARAVAAALLGAHWRTLLQSAVQSDARGGPLSRQDRRLCLYAPLWRDAHDRARMRRARTA